MTCKPISAPNGAPGNTPVCVTSAMPQMLALAMAYVPFQQFGSIYEPEQALSNGTLFPDLNKPFCGRKEGR